MTRPFNDRAEAERALASKLTHLRGPNVILLALPRGGVPVAAEVAAGLAAPPDVFNVRKVGVPWPAQCAHARPSRNRASPNAHTVSQDACVHP